MTDKPHKHLCQICNGIFECFDQSDAEFEFSTCEDCKTIFNVQRVTPHGERREKKGKSNVKHRKS